MARIEITQVIDENVPPPLDRMYSVFISTSIPELTCRFPNEEWTSLPLLIERFGSSKAICVDQNISGEVGIEMTGMTHDQMMDLLGERWKVLPPEEVLVWKLEKSSRT